MDRRGGASADAGAALNPILMTAGDGLARARTVIGACDRSIKITDIPGVFRSGRHSAPTRRMIGHFSLPGRLDHL
jgi:hypothetical protein